MRVSVWRQEFVRHPSNDSLRYVKVENNGVTRYGWCDKSRVPRYDFSTNDSVSLAEAMQLFNIRQLKGA